MEELFAEQVKKNRLSFDSIHTTGTPRRLVLFASGLPQRQEDIVQEVAAPRQRLPLMKVGNRLKRLLVLQVHRELKPKI